MPTPYSSTSGRGWQAKLTPPMLQHVLKIEVNKPDHCHDAQQADQAGQASTETGGDRTDGRHNRKYSPATS
jgi:hypothetical protein